MAENDNMVISSSDLMTILNSDSEELKSLKDENAYIHSELQAIGATADMFEKEIRAKAIDEFVNLVNECSGYTPNCIEHDLSLTVYTIHQIADQLKGGAV